MKSTTLQEIRRELTIANRALGAVERLRKINLDLLIIVQDYAEISRIADNVERAAIDLVRHAIDLS